MYYVYILTSLSHPDQKYTGFTTDVAQRLKRHNSGHVTHTSKYRPWKIETYIAFSDRQKALKFERYLKSGSGRAFSKKRF